MRKLLVTGGAGFIGTNFVYFWTDKHPKDQIAVLDALTYAGNKSSILPLIDSGHITFVQGDICNADLLKSLFKKYKFDVVVNPASETMLIAQL